MKSRIIPAIVAITFLISCTTTQYMGASYPATEKVDVYFSPSDVKKEYTVMGKIDGKDLIMADFEKIEEDIVKEAKKKGADGVIISGMGNEVIGTSKTKISSATTSTTNTTERVVHADFIKYK